MSNLKEGMKFDGGKLRYDLVPPEALKMMVAIYTVGAIKYEDRNWEKGMKWSRPFSALMRHAWDWWSGEDKDPDSSWSHMAHVAWNAFCLLQYEMTHPEFDDRPDTPLQDSGDIEKLQEVLERWAQEYADKDKLKQKQRT